MKYAVSLSHFKGNQLVDIDIKIIKATDPTILKDALFKIISLKTRLDHRSYTSSKMGCILGTQPQQEHDEFWSVQDSSICQRT